MAALNIAAPTAIHALDVSGQVPTGVDTKWYQVPAGRAAKITLLRVTNDTGSPVAVGVAVVVNPGTTDSPAAKIVPDAYSLGAGDSLPVLEPGEVLWLGELDAIWVNPSAAVSLNVFLSGLEFQ